jgi:transposase
LIAVVSEAGLLSRVELFECIRRDWRLEKTPVRELARKYGVHRRTVRQALESALPPERKAPAKRRSVLDPAKGWIDEMLRADLTAPPKQRHTNRRIVARLRDEYDFAAAYTTLSEYLQKRRPEIKAEAVEGRAVQEGMVPQLHKPGEEAEVDFAEVWVRVDGKPLQCHLLSAYGLNSPSAYTRTSPGARPLPSRRVTPR